MLLLQLLSSGTKAAEPDVFHLKTEDLRQVAINLAVIWVLAVVAWQVIKLLARRVVAVADAHHGDSQTFRDKRAKTIAQLLRSVGWGFLMILTLLLTLRQFFDIGPLLGATAVLGLAVSFGAQSLVKDYFAGFFILFENQFVVGDVIEAAGKSGTVERLTLRMVRIRDIDGTVHVIPNGLITTLSNKTRGWSRAVVDIGISYDNDVDRAIAVLQEEAERIATDAAWAPRFDAPPEVLGVESFGDNGVTIRVLLRTKPGIQGEVAREYRRRVLIRLEREGIKGARAQQTIAVLSHGPAPVAAAAVSPIPGAE
jgi:small conductance mechanosensitive channel